MLEVRVMKAIWQKIWQYKWWIAALIIVAVAAKFGSDYYAKSNKLNSN
jgi:hypothetical protein